MYLREDFGNKACLVGKTVLIQMQWAGHMARMKEEIVEKIRGRGTRGLQRTRKATAKMGGLCEERSKKGSRAGRNIERTESDGNNNKSGLTVK